MAASRGDKYFTNIYFLSAANADDFSAEKDIL
jgi:hypothetical protein